VDHPQKVGVIMSVRETVSFQANRGGADSPIDGLVQRFGRTERFVHWWTALMMAVAMLSGLGMGDDGRSAPLLTVHIAAVVMIAVGVAGALLFGVHRDVFHAAHELFVLDRRDAAWLRARIHDPFHPDANPSWGMFNTGQKLLAWALTGSVTVVVVTGVLSWSRGGEGGPHGAAVLLTGILLAAHVFMAVVNPRTRPALRGMVLGSVRRSWAAEHHRHWLETADQERSYPKRADRLLNHSGGDRERHE
jgi:cytochrome b subunit of formate dehydrogenase